MSAATSDVPSARRAVVGLRGWGSQLGLVFPGGSTGCSAQAEEQWRAQLSPCCSLCPSTGQRLAGGLQGLETFCICEGLVAHSSCSVSHQGVRSPSVWKPSLLHFAGVPQAARAGQSPARAFPLTHRRRQELSLALGVVHPAQVDFSSSSK